MKRIYRIILLLLTASVLAGCASAHIQKVQLPEAANASNIIIFRPFDSEPNFPLDQFVEMIGARKPAWMQDVFEEMIVTVDDTECAVLKRLQYVSVAVEPGEHTVSVRSKIGLRSKVTVQAKRFGDVYLKAGKSWHTTYFMRGYGLGLVKPNFYIKPAKKINRTNYRPVQVKYNYNCKGKSEEFGAKILTSKDVTTEN